MAKTLTNAELESRKEVPVQLNLKGIVKGYRELFYDVPVKFLEKASRKTENATKHMMTGFGAVITMPLGIVVRNSVRNFHESVRKDGKYDGWGKFGGVAGAAAGWGLSGYALYGAGLAATGIAGTIGSVGVGIGAAVVTGLLVTVPAFTVGVLAAGVLAAAGTGVLSTVLAAPRNIKNAWQRTKDRFQGIKHDVNKLEPDWDKYSLQGQYEERTFNKANRAVHYLNEDQQKKIYDTLKEKFEAAQANDDVAQGQDIAAPAANKKKTSGPKK